MNELSNIFERGAAMNNGMCLREAAEYYAKPCESNKRILQDIQKALRYYERAAISPDYLDFNDHAYVTMQAIILRTLNIRWSVPRLVSYSSLIATTSYLHS